MDEEEEDEDEDEDDLAAITDSRFTARFINSSPLFLSSRNRPASFPAVMRYVRAPLDPPESPSVACTTKSGPWTAPCDIIDFICVPVVVVCVEEAIVVVIVLVAVPMLLVKANSLKDKLY